MRKILSVLFILALLATSAYALSTEAILNTVFDTTNNGIKGTISGNADLTDLTVTSVSGDAISADSVWLIRGLTGNRPTLAWGAGNDGFYSPSVGVLYYRVQGENRWQWDSGYLRGLNGSGYLMNENASATNPVFATDSQLNTGLGGATTYVGNLIANGTNVVSFDATGANVQTGKLMVNGIKSGATQAAAGAVAGELYHCITSDSIKIGV